MTTELIERPTESALLLTVTPETVKTLAARCLSLKVNGIDDAEGLAKVKDALRECVSARKTCEKEIAAVKEPHLRACQVCDKTRRDILALIAEPESYLEDQAAVIEREKARQAQAERDALTAHRRQLLAEAGGSLPGDLLGRMGQIEFDMALGNARRDAQERNEAEARKAAEAEQLRADQARLQAERAEFEQRQRDEEARRQAELKQLQEMRDKLAEETRRIQTEEADRRNKAQAAEAAERAAKDRAERERREALEATAAEERAAEARRKAEAMRPDREKLRTVAAALAEIDVPEVGPDAQQLAHHVAAIVEQARYEIVQLLKS